MLRGEHYCGSLTGWSISPVDSRFQSSGTQKGGGRPQTTLIQCPRVRLGKTFQQQFWRPSEVGEEQVQGLFLWVGEALGSICVGCYPLLVYVALKVGFQQGVPLCLPPRPRPLVLSLRWKGGRCCCKVMLWNLKHMTNNLATAISCMVRQPPMWCRQRNLIFSWPKAHLMTMWGDPVSPVEGCAVLGIILRIQHH